MPTQVSASYVTERGPAVGRIHGVNHLVLIVDDMDASVRFYRDLLGFKVVRTVAYPVDPAKPLRVPKTYFFDIGAAGGALLGLFEVQRDCSLSDPGTEPALVPTLWPGESSSVNPRKLDHLAFNVDTRDDVVWFHDHLRATGVEVSDVTSLAGRFEQGFVESIYFYDPSGNPLEIATCDWEHPRWNNKPGAAEQTGWLQDRDPVAALRPYEAP